MQIERPIPNIRWIEWRFVFILMQKLTLVICLFLLWSNAYAKGFVINSKADLDRAIKTKETICIIEGDIDLSGGLVEFPMDSYICFRGGMIRNGKVKGLRTSIAADYRCFEGVSFSGSFQRPLSLDCIVDCRNQRIDCAKYINNLFEIQNTVVLPDYPIHIYSSIRMGTGKSLHGLTQLHSTIYVHNCNGIELENNVRNIEISHLSLTNNNRDGYYPTNTSSGICSIGDMTGAHIRIHDVNLNGFKYGIHFMDVFWSSSIEKCRFNHCDIGFWGDRKTIGSSIVNSFTDNTFMECLTYGLFLDGYNEVMISSCNFGGLDRKITHDTQMALCRLNYCKCVEIHCCNFEKMALANYSAALYFNTSDAQVSDCTFADLYSADLPNEVSRQSFSSAILANYNSNVQIIHMRTKNNRLFTDILCYQKATVDFSPAKDYLVRVQTYSGGVINGI